MVTDFTGAQSARLTQAIEISKGRAANRCWPATWAGRCPADHVINNQNFDPNTAAQRGHSGIQLNLPREVHALNDAILAAATALSKRPLERRRVIYVISDGKEYGSAAKTKDVIEVSADEPDRGGWDAGGRFGAAGGRLPRPHPPAADDARQHPAGVCARRPAGTSTRSSEPVAIEKSFAKIAEEVRNRYTLGYIHA